MIELLGYLASNGFTNYIASGGGRDFMRPDQRGRCTASRASGSSAAAPKFAYTPTTWAARSPTSRGRTTSMTVRKPDRIWIAGPADCRCVAVGNYRPEDGGSWPSSSNEERRPPLTFAATRGARLGHPAEQALDSATPGLGRSRMGHMSGERVRGNDAMTGSVMDDSPGGLPSAERCPGSSARPTRV